MCAVVNDVHFLLINVYMPCVGNNTNSNDFSMQPSVINNVMEQIVKCQIIISSNFYVDFCWSWSHFFCLVNFVIWHFCSQLFNMNVALLIICPIFGMQHLIFLIILVFLIDHLTQLLLYFSSDT